MEVILRWEMEHPCDTEIITISAASPVALNGTPLYWRLRGEPKSGGMEWRADHDAGLPPDVRTWPSQSLAMAAVLNRHCEILHGRGHGHPAGGMMVDGNYLSETLVMMNKIEELTRESGQLKADLEARKSIQASFDYLEKLLASDGDRAEIFREGERLLFTPIDPLRVYEAATVQGAVDRAGEGEALARAESPEETPAELCCICRNRPTLPNASTCYDCRPLRGI